MTNNTPQSVRVTSIAAYVESQSDPKSRRYVFSYTVTIENLSDLPCQLLSRHWVIQDANRKIEEVYGEGVIGQQPVIAPGEKYRYSSGAVLETEVGTMEGRYFMISKSVDKNNTEFDIPIPKFTLAVPRTLH